MHTFDHELFLALNFDGGPLLDRILLIVSGTAIWLPLYGLILYLVWRQYGWRQTLLFLALMGAAIGLADMVAGIFKHNGLLGGLMPDLQPRLRPMFTPSLEGLEITPDSLSALRRSADTTIAWAVHVPREALSGRYGTVSAHAATIVALATLSASVIRRRWYTALIVVCSLLICYSRIYLAKHFPVDLIWGGVLGLLLGGAAYALFRRFGRQR